MQDRTYRTVQVLSVISKLVRGIVIVIAAWVAMTSWENGNTFPTVLALGVMVMGLVALWRSVVRWNRIKNTYKRRR